MADCEPQQHQPQEQEQQQQEQEQQQQQQEHEGSVSSAEGASANEKPPATMSRTVLLAVDFSERSERLIRWYSQCASYNTDKVVLGYVIEPPSMHVGHFTPLASKEQEYYTIEGGRQRAQELGNKLKQAAVTLGLENVTFRGEFYGSSAPVGILQLAEEIGASVIFINSRSFSKMKKIIRGSTADHILRNSPRPVVVMPPESLNHVA